MKSLRHCVLFMCVTLGWLCQPTHTAVADDTKLEGKWKLVVLAFGDDDFIVFETKEADGKLSGDVVAAQSILGKTAIRSIDQKADKTTVVFVTAGQESPFHGAVARDGDEPRPLLGTFRFRGAVYPARLEKTDADALTPLNQSNVPKELSAAMRERNAKVRMERLEKILSENPGKPYLNRVYSAIFQAATDAELKLEQVQAHLRNMLNVAEPYGAEWNAQVRLEALRALSGKPPFARLALPLAEGANKSLGEDASTEDRAAITKLYADAAKLAGKSDLAASLEALWNKLEAKLDAEYHEKVPPFKPTTYSGRKNSDDDRVVVLELFTGSQCAPCVAADVGFDALITTYQPTELVALQYHLHIPGPDPLTNASSLARAKFYGVQSTPSTFFNGELAAKGGGFMPQSQGKYNQYRNIIDERLYGTKPASIELKVKRVGNKVQIAASATADLSDLTEKTGKEKDKPKNQSDEGTAQKSDSDAKPQDQEPKLKLYLAVAEQTVRYVGGNKIRFHHNLVRAFAGGKQGKEFNDGSCDSNVSLDLTDVRKELDDYLNKFQETGSFPNPLPPIELKGLSIVAFVQDDMSKKILHAMVVPVPDTN